MFRAALVALLLVSPAACRGEAASPGELTPLAIETADGAVTFLVELADDDAERAMGLMYRDALGEDRGMLFDFGQPQLVSFWMKNTAIPLDMLFIRADGTIAEIAAGTTPYSTKSIPSGEPVRAVLEINAGLAARLGIAPGDRVRHALFGDAPAP